MRRATLSSSSTHLRGRINYDKLTRLELTERIANHSDTEAAKEHLENRPLSRPEYKGSHNLVEYIALLRDSGIAKRWCGYDALVLDAAYDLTIDKFFNIPVQTDDDEQQRSRCTDCRPYFLAYFIYTSDLFKENPPANALEADMISSESMRKMVVRQFRFSCREARRRLYKFVRRYRWRFPEFEKDIYVWLPWEIPRGQCQAWLKVQILDVDPQRPGEQERVQQEIDWLLAKRKLFSLEELDRVGESLPPSPDPLPSAIETQVSVEGLAETVACEKAERIKEQRPTIYHLGEEKLKKLIRTVFAKLAYGEYVEKDIARRFGLSEATFSRFAGSRWQSSSDDTVESLVPDLWRNVAHTLADHLDFVVAAQKAGVWKRVSGVLGIKNKARRI